MPMTRRKRLDVRLTASVANAGCAAKLGPADLRTALGRVPAPRRDRRVLVDHTTLDDAGVFAWGRGEALVQTVDFFTPILDDPYDFCQVAAANALSDVYAMGGQPLTALALVCFPDGDLAPEVLGEMLRGGQDKIVESGASIVGGHTVRDRELKFGYAVTGVVKRRRMLTNAGARAGDRLLLTKPLGAGILATALKQGLLDARETARLTKTLVTLNRRAAEAAVTCGARAATDVTGFSLVGHARQMAEASGVTFRLRPEPRWFMPRALDLAADGVFPGGVRRNRAYYGEGLDTSGLSEPVALGLFDPQTSGGLLIAVPPRRFDAMRLALKRRRVWTAELGQVTAPGPRPIEFELR
jgi:selenide,water dikinase